jgi:hypothetical protein
MQQSWPEWLGAHAFAFAFVLGWSWLITGHVSTADALNTVQMFGPFFGFIMAGGYALDAVALDPVAMVSAIVMLVFVHAFMLFRGFLFQSLHGTSRRGRAWRARMG